MHEPLIQVRGLMKHYPVTKGLLLRRVTGWLKAVDDVTFHIASAETLGLVGESGCGKTTTARLLLLLQEPTGGSILFNGQDITRSRGAARRSFRQTVQAVFQDPWSSLNPRMRVGKSIAEPMLVAGGYSRSELRDTGGRAA
jgi:oligopeptide transport system ATP-binding protein